MNNKKILIVEDDHALRAALRDKLARERFSVLEAKDGEEGLKVALDEQPDLILSDIVMPKMDGLTMISRLREDAWGKTAHVIMLTNLSDGESVSASLENAAFDYLVKSDWKLEDIVEKIRNQLQKK